MSAPLWPEMYPAWLDRHEADIDRAIAEDETAATAQTAADPRRKAMADALALCAAAGRASRRAAAEVGGSWFADPARYRRLFQRFLREEEARGGPQR